MFGKRQKDRGEGQLGSVSPVMRFLMSLASSFFLHSSKPVTAAGFGRDGRGEVSGVKAYDRSENGKN